VYVHTAHAVANERAIRDGAHAVRESGRLDVDAQRRAPEVAQRPQRRLAEMAGASRDQ
jgi:hypothetical protein